MFKVGDKVIYPSQGVGIIKQIEEREFKGKMQNYYKIHLLNNDMKLTLPFSRVVSCNMRLLSDCDVIDDSLRNIHNFKTEVDELENSDFKKRAAMNTMKVKNGKLDDYLEVICNLSRIEREYHLNSSEKQILDEAKCFVVDEISHVKGIPKGEAQYLLEKSIKNNYPI